MTELKYCKNCGIVRNENTTYFRNKSKGRLQYLCKKCFNKNTLSLLKKKKLKWIKYLGGKCWFCLYNSYPGALDFHHLDRNEKSFSWDLLKSKSNNIIKKELDKCILVCSNCHKELEHLLFLCKTEK